MNKDFDQEWSRVEDISDDNPTGCTLTAMFYYDLRTKKREKIAELPPFVKKALLTELSRLNPAFPIKLQLYCSKKTVKTKESDYPYLICSLLDEYAFTLELNKDTGLAINRRYMAVSKKE